MKTYFKGSSAKRVGNILPGGARRPLFSRGKAHSAQLENLSRRLAWPGEQELLLLLESFIFNNNIVLPGFAGFQTSLSATAPTETSTRDVEEPQKPPTRFAEEPEFLHAQPVKDR